MYAYAIAHNFIADRREFIRIALAPFVLINLLLAVLAVLFVPLRFYLLGVLLIHTAGTSGDFTLLNLFWLNRHQAVYTYDDASEQRSYFYARNE